MVSEEVRHSRAEQERCLGTPVSLQRCHRSPRALQGRDAPRALGEEEAGAGAVVQARGPQGVTAGCGVAGVGQEKSNSQEPAVASD